MSKNDSLWQPQMAHFIGLSEEKLILATRGHWFILAPPFVLTIFISYLLISASFYFTFFFDLQFSLFVITLFIIILTTTTFIAKAFSDWYFHLYVVTDRRLLEIFYVPLFSHTINEVLLDQVRCTEVDVRTDGVINKIFDKGNVVVTFDRPTHQQEFVLSDIQDPKNAGIILCDGLINHAKQDVFMPVWYRSRENPNHYRMTEEINPRIMFQ